MSNLTPPSDGLEAWTDELRDDIEAWLDELLIKLPQYNCGDDPTTDKPFTADETMAVYPELKEAKQALLSKFKEVERDSRIDELNYVLGGSVRCAFHQATGTIGDGFDCICKRNIDFDEAKDRLNALRSKK